MALTTEQHAKILDVVKELRPIMADRQAQSVRLITLAHLFALTTGSPRVGEYVINSLAEQIDSDTKIIESLVVVVDALLLPV
ncbi:MAG: hypothetical protein ABIP74_01315 [Candidatus Saccharimonas sp.]